MKLITTSLCLSLLAVLFTCNPVTVSDRIDRHALVSRNNPVLTEPDTLGSLTVGNGGFAFTVDASGLQTFYKEYENGIPLGTMADWGWHTTPDANSYTLADVATDFESCDGQVSPYPVQHSSGRAGEATNSLRSNPHRLHLGLFGLDIKKKDGSSIKLQDITNLRQELDLWRGTISTYYDIEGTPVSVRLVAYPKSDGIAVHIISPLINEGRLKLRIRFPYAQNCHVCPGYDFENPEKHSTEVINKGINTVITRKLDSTLYQVHLHFLTGEVRQQSPHEILLSPDSSSGMFDLRALFNDSLKGPATFDEVWEGPKYFDEVWINSAETWREFWTTGGAIDFSECTDPRAKELERRVVLSQYLTAIQCDGIYPPQETGLTMNSWYGKFHLEMHLWHAVHFGMWNRRDELERAMTWYNTSKEKAAATAKWQGYEGYRWQKMTDPDGNESPSNIGAFIIWQQPHPIFLSEMIYQLEATEQEEVLRRYQEIIFGTADFMSSFIKLRDGKYHLCHPLIPAQEIFRPMETDDPTYELQYWHYALNVAQEWRKRLGMPPNEKWQQVIDNIAPLPQSNGMYLPTATAPDAYTDDNFRRDHPSVLAALGFLPANDRIDTAVMRRTLNEILRKWDWSSTWGWDYPMIAMTATRLYEPEKAIEALLMDTQKNTYLVNGHNYQDKRLRLYLPGNGGLLAATALMAAGWQGCTQESPGFPKDGRWNVRWENLATVP
jgi:hypothetical protein